MPIEQVWSLLGDTNQLNQDIGLFPARFAPFTHEDGSLFRLSRAKAFGAIEIAWREYIFEWIKQQSYSIERIYSKGPAVRAQWKVSVEPQGDSTTLLRLKGDYTNRNLVGQLAMKMIIIPQKEDLYANEILEYFGRTVNRAARIQQQSVGSDVVISENDYRDLLESADFSLLDSV